VMAWRSAGWAADQRLCARAARGTTSDGCAHWRWRCAAPGRFSL